MKIRELNAGQPVVGSTRLMEQHFRNVLLQIIRRFNSGGEVNRKIVAKTANFTITDNDYLINVTSGSPTITLPTAVGRQGREYVVKNSGAGTVTLDGDGSETIDGAATQNIAANNSVTVVSDGANWLIV